MYEMLHTYTVPYTETFTSFVRNRDGRQGVQAAEGSAASGVLSVRAGVHNFAADRRVQHIQKAAQPRNKDCPRQLHQNAGTIYFILVFLETW